MLVLMARYDWTWIVSIATLAVSAGAIGVLFFAM